MDERDPRYRVIYESNKEIEAGIDIIMSFLKSGAGERLKKEHLGVFSDLLEIVGILTSLAGLLRGQLSYISEASKIVGKEGSLVIPFSFIGNVFGAAKKEIDLRIKRSGNYIDPDLRNIINKTLSTAFTKLFELAFK